MKHGRWETSLAESIEWSRICYHDVVTKVEEKVNAEDQVIGSCRSQQITARSGGNSVQVMVHAPLQKAPPRRRRLQ